MMEPMEKRLDTGQFDTDKSQLYLRNYQEHFQHLRGKDIKLFELGIHKGGSLRLWRDYFPNGTIVGLDRGTCQIDDPTDRIHIYQGFQQDVALLDQIGQEMAPDGFDIIIDDASHLGQLTRISFWHLFDNHLKQGGLYVIEDWRTGYWDAWRDGKQYNPLSKQRAFQERLLQRLMLKKHRSIPEKILLRLVSRKRFPSHCFGMVGVIKELVDELGMDMITNPARKGIGPQRYPKFRKMQVSPGQVFIVKATERDHELIAEQSKGSS
jgi:hypothetical protein